MLILGIDPGSRHTGWGVLEVRGGEPRALAHGRISLAPSEPLPRRLAVLGRELAGLLERFRPDAAVLETPFHGMNSRSLVVLAEARGALLAVIGAHGIETREYSPAEVKSAVTGYGRADKARVARMIGMLLSIPPDELSGDAADALAVALCYAHRQRLESQVGGAGG